MSVTQSSLSESADVSSLQRPQDLPSSSTANQDALPSSATRIRSAHPRKDSADINRCCWVCFAGEDDHESKEEISGGWLKPCKCRNATKWVHQHCLQRWIDEKQRGNPSTAVACPQCNYPYVIQFPKQTKFIKLLEVYERWIQKSCPLLAAAFAAGAVYWTSVSYGAFTIMQIFGSREGLELIEKGDPLFLLIVMPAIPICLVLGKLVKWEDLVLKLWRKHSKKVLDFFQNVPERRYYRPTAHGQGGVNQPAPQGARDPVEAAIISDPISATRVLCGALVLPTISLMFGKVLFSKVQPSLQRTILGGISFIVCKGVLKMYFRQQQFLRTLKREIQNYSEPQSSAVQTSASVGAATNNNHEVEFDVQVVDGANNNEQVDMQIVGDEEEDYDATYDSPPTDQPDEDEDDNAFI